MYSKINTTIAVLLFFVATACNRSPKNMVSYAKNFNQIIENQQNLIFSFNHDLVSQEKVGNWDSVEYLTIKPAVKGRFRWANRRELVFSPAKGFEPSTEYTAEFTNKLLKNADNQKLYIGKEYKKIKFNTEFLAPQAVNSFWAKGKNGDGIVIRLNLLFNYPIETTQLKNLLKIKVGEKEVQFTIDNSEKATESVFLTINGSEFGKEQSLITVKRLKGIALAKGNYKTKEEFELSQVLASRFDMVISNVETGFKDNKGFVRITTSQELDPLNIEKAYTIEPAITTKAELTENGLFITGDFAVNNLYNLVLKKEFLKGSIGGVLKDDSFHELYFGEMAPSISFRNKKAIYLSKSGTKNIGVDIVNVPEVQVIIYKIYENNILSYLNNNSYNNYNGYYYDDEYYYGEDYTSYNTNNTESYGAEVMNRTIKTTDLPKVNGISALTLDLPPLDEFKGIYLVKISSKTDYYLSATKLISISDIGVISKQSDKDLFIYTNSILTAESMGDVDIQVISSNNQNVLQLKTDGKGIAVIKDFKEKMRHFSPSMLTMRKGEDFNYLLLSQTNVETSRFDISGKQENSTGLDVYVYGDRNIYRPGEKVHFNAIVRNTQWEPAADVPMKVKIIMPNGKEYSSIRKNTNKQGAIAGSFDIAVSAVTGNYTIEIYNGNDVLMTSENIGVEEFMPDRIKNTLTTSKTSYYLNETVVAKIEATNYFGPPASNRNYEIEFSLARKDFSPKKYKDYNFYISTKQSFNSVLREGTTTETGTAEESFELNAEYADMGVLQSSIYATVFDESGRPVTRNKKIDIFTQKVMYGLKIEDYYLATNKPMKTQLVAVDKEGNPIRGARAAIEVVRYEWQNVLTRYYDDYRYQSRKVEKVVENKVLVLPNGEASYSFIPPVSGEYEVRIKREGANRYVASNFYAYSWGNTLSTSFDVNTEGTIDIVFDKEKYEVGEDAKVLFKTPFAGKLLVTIERNGIFEHQIIETDKKSAEITLEVKEEFLPNVYVSATLIKPLQNSNIPLTVAHGYANLSVEKKSTILPVEIIAVEKSRSSTKQKITVKTKAEAGIEVTIAVVDEGILALKNFTTPNPHGYFYAKKALQVKSYDLYPYLFPEMSSRSSSGGDGYDLEKRVNPLSNNRVKLVAFWSGILTTNSSGQVTYEVDLPKFSGDLRIMAVAYKNKAFGSAGKNMKVADPLVVSTGLPRFFSPGDEIEMPINISNTTAKNANTVVSVSLSGPITANTELTQKISVSANKENRAFFKISAKAQMGNAKIKVSVKGFGETFTEETEITVRPSTSLLKTALAGTINAGEKKELSPNTDYIPSSIESKLVISKNPMTEFIDRFQYLVHYPHGCLEQTVSAAFPQLYFAEFVKNASQKSKTQLKTGENELNPEFNVREAIRKLQGMQLYNGGMSYWQGGYYESWWGSTYAAHFLIEAKAAGYDVDNAVMEKLLDYINYKASQEVKSQYRYYNNETYETKEYVNREVIYCLYILSRAGRPNRAQMNYYKTNANLLTEDCKYMLAAAFALTSDRISFDSVLPKGYVEYDKTHSTDGSFYSPMRNLAISLHSLVESNINHPQIPTLSRNLSQMLRNSRYANTQELSFAFLALGKLAQKANATNISATIKVNGKVVGNFANQDITIDNKLLKGQQVSITTSGKGMLFYYYETEGLSSTGKYVEEDNFLRVRKEFFNRFGQRIVGNTFKQNDLIVVRISIAALNSLDIKNVVVTDMLPAGFEIENPRITEGREFDWTIGRAFTDHFDVRDDRINFFLSPRNDEQYLYYTVRAVTKGTFKMGPVSADAMYNGEYHSYNGAGTIIVQ